MCYQVLMWTVDVVINFKIYLQSSSRAMEKKGGRKRGEDRNTKI